MDQRVPCTAERDDGVVCRKACQRQARTLALVPRERLEQAIVLCGQNGERMCGAEPMDCLEWARDVLTEYERCRRATVEAYGEANLNENFSGWSCILLTHV